MRKSIAIVVIGLILIALTYAWWKSYQPGMVMSITTFEECRAAGYPVIDGSPYSRCITSDGRTFIYFPDRPIKSQEF